MTFLDTFGAIAKSILKRRAELAAQRGFVVLLKICRQSFIITFHMAPREKSREVEVATRLPLIDATSLSSSLTPEIVTNGEMQAIVRSAEAILAVDGVESTVNAIPARVSKGYAEVKVGKKVYYARAFSLEDNEEQQLPGIVFDETIDPEVQTPNPFALRFVGDKDRPLLMRDNELDPIINSPQDIALVKDILKVLGHAKVEREQALAVQTEEERLRRHRLRERRLEHAKTFGVRAGATVAAIGAVGLGVFGLISGVMWIEEHTPQDEPEPELRLSGGAEIALGSSDAPEFSSKLFENTTDIQNMGSDGRFSDVELDLQDPVREVFITSSKKSKNCTSFNIARIPLDTKLVAWTDFTAADGTSRADELEVKHEVQKGTVCWNGEERGDLDDPRIVVKLKPAPAEAKTTAK